MAKEKTEKKKSEKTEKESSELGLVKKPVSARGRIFEGCVTKKFPKRVSIEFERTVYIPKYERFLKKKTRIHARLPENIDVNKGDIIKVRECRPLSKMIHFVVIKKIKSAIDASSS